jgi:hypothetical protein
MKIVVEDSGWSQLLLEIRASVRSMKELAPLRISSRRLCKYLNLIFFQNFCNSAARIIPVTAGDLMPPV